MELINIDDAIRAVDRHMLEDGTLDNDISCILEEVAPVMIPQKAQPLAQPEIVMCADCQKYIDYRCRDEHANLNDWRHEDDYCSFGKRREDDHETD